MAARRSWEKPDLGLVEYHGSKRNNLVDMGEDMHVQACVVFHESDEADPARRFKMAFQPRKHSGRLCVAYSASQCPAGSGLAQPITWGRQDVIEGVSDPIRVRVDFVGVRPEDVRLYAVYLDPA